MDFKKGMILTNSGANYWCQYVLKNGLNDCVVFDGRERINSNILVPLDDLIPTPLPIGLSALGFIEIRTEDGARTHYRNGDMEIVEREFNKYYINNNPVKFTFEVQEAFGLFELISNHNNLF